MMTGRLASTALLVILILSCPLLASDVIQKATGEKLLGERLHAYKISDRVWRGAMPEPANYAVLAANGVTRAISLLSESEVPDDAKTAAREAGIAYQFHPIALNEGGAAEDVRVDRAEVIRIVDDLARVEDGVVYVHCGTGRDRSGVIDFTFGVRYYGWSFARAMKVVLDRGFNAGVLPGFVDDMKLLASGLDELPIVKGIPIAEEELTAPGTLVPVGGARLNTKYRGEGPPVYLLHGGPGESHMTFRPYFDTLSYDFTVLYFDQRGCGHSSKPQFKEAYTIDRLVSDLDRLRAYAGHDKISLLAHSSGGAIAVKYALTHPERVDKLIIISSWASAEEILEYAQLRERMMSALEVAQMQAIRHQLIAEGRFFNDEELTRSTRIFMPHDFFGRLSPEFRADWARHLKVSVMPWQSLSGEYLGTPDAPGSLDLRPELGRLKGIPTLVLAGKFDAVTPPELAVTFAKGIPGAQLVVFERSGHFPYIEENGRVLEVVRGFLAGESR